MKTIEELALEYERVKQRYAMLGMLNVSNDPVEAAKQRIEYLEEQRSFWHIKKMLDDAIASRWREIQPETDAKL